MRKVEHIGIAVRSLIEANARFARLFGQPPYKTETVLTEGVSTAFFRVGETKIELLESTDPDGPVAKFLARRGEGIHHIAYDVADIRAEMQRLAAEGFTLLSAEPKPGADNKLVCFLHPKDTHGVLIELCQERPTADQEPGRAALP